MPRRKSDTGESTPYDQRDQEQLYDALAQSGMAEDETRTDITVRGEIEWSGSYNPTPERTTTLVDLDLKATGEALAKARADHAKAKPLASYDAKGWHAKLSQLTGTEHGRKSLAESGFSARLLTGWLSDPDANPRKGNRETIDRVYENTRMAPVIKAQESKAALAGRFTDAIRNRYGAEVRIFGAHNFHM